MGNGTFEQLTVRLGNAFGNRRVVNGLGDPAPVIRAASVPRPATVPPGYTAEPVTIGSGPIGSVPGVPGGTPDVIALRVYRRGIDRLEIRTGRPQELTPLSVNVGYPLIGSHQGILSASPVQPEHCLSWTVSAARAVEICGEGDLRSSSAYPPPPPIADSTLITMARTLR